MNFQIYDNCESFDYNKKFELLNRLIEFTGLRYVGEWGHYTLPLGHFNGLPYLESNYFGDGVTIRRITNLDEVFLPHFNSTVETVYRMVMGITEPNWESVRKVSITIEDGETIWNAFPSVLEQTKYE
jgi:hypothetical protein